MTTSPTGKLHHFLDKQKNLFLFASSQLAYFVVDSDDYLNSTFRSDLKQEIRQLIDWCADSKLEQIEAARLSFDISQINERLLSTITEFNKDFDLIELCISISSNDYEITEKLDPIKTIAASQKVRVNISLPYKKFLIEKSHLPTASNYVYKIHDVPLKDPLKGKNAALQIFSSVDFLDLTQYMNLDRTSFLLFKEDSSKLELQSFSKMVFEEYVDKPHGRALPGNMQAAFSYILSTRYKVAWYAYNSQIESFIAQDNDICNKCWAKKICWSAHMFSLFSESPTNFNNNQYKCDFIRELIEHTIVFIHRIKQEKFLKPEISFKHFKLKQIV